MIKLDHKTLIAITVSLGVLYWFARREVVAVANAVNPVNQDNVFALGANAIVRKLTGDEHQTLGGWIFDLTHKQK